MADVQGLLADPKFNSLDEATQRQVLGRLDPTFSTLDSSGYQAFRAKVGLKPQLQVQGVEADEPKDAGFFHTLWNDATGVGPKLLEAGQHPWESIKSGLESATAARRSLGPKADEEFARGNTLGGLGYKAASYLPFIGPAAAGAGEEIGNGQTGQGLAHGLETLLPFVGGAGLPEVTRAVGTGIRNAAAATGKFATSPGVPEMVGGGGAVMGSPFVALKGHPMEAAITGTGGGMTFLRGLEKYRASKVPPVPPVIKPTSPPPLRGSSLPPIEPTITPTPPPPLRWNAAVPEPAPAPSTPPPPIRWNAAPPAPPTPKPVPIPPIKWGPQRAAGAVAEGGEGSEAASGGGNLFTAPPAATPPTTPTEPMAPVGSTAVPANAPTFKHTAEHTDLMRQSHAVAGELGLKHVDLSSAAKKVFGVKSYSDLSYDQALALNEYMLKNKALPTGPVDLLPK